jgi:Tol biopolymer transport system component
MRRFLVLFMLLLVVGCAAPSGKPGAKFPGRLAYERGGKVYILEGRREREVGIGRSPAWSFDGAWLAYVGSDAVEGPYRLQMVRADGTGMVQFPDLPASEPVMAWSPAERVLAVGWEHGLWLARPDGAVKALDDHPQGVYSFAWSPDGARLAYVTTEPRQAPLPPADTLWTVAVTGGSPVPVLRAPEGAIYVADWWPDGQSLLYWMSPIRSASIAADGLPLRRLDLATGATNHLETTLLNRRWISWAPDGQRFLAVAGGGRAAWVGKALSVCDRQACRPVEQPPGVVRLDGVWAPAGNRIAFVQAEARPFEAGAEGWMETRRLWVSAADGSGAQEVGAAGSGVYSPQWEKDGRHLLYARDGALWYLAVDGGVPVKLAEISQPDPVYYGQIIAPVAWYQP